MEQPENGVLKWMFQCALRDRFGADRQRMAMELRIGESKLKRALDTDDAPETMLLFERLMLYYAERSLSIDEILSKCPKPQNE